MPWTPPVNYTDGQLITESDLDTQLSGNMSALKDPPTASYAKYTDSLTTSTSWAAIDVTNMTWTLTTHGGALMIGMSGNGYSSGSGYPSSGLLDVLIDGLQASNQWGGGLFGLYGVSFGAAGTEGFGFVWLTQPYAAGGHVVQPIFKTTVAAASFNLTRFKFWVREVS
jgi:hypothetical protein